MNLPNLPADRNLVTPGDGRSTDSWHLFFDGLVKWIRGNGGTVYGTRAQRTTVNTRGYQNPRGLAEGTAYVETDTGAVYQLRAGAWSFVSGAPYRLAQADLATLAATLGTADEGITVEVTDYRHTLRWTGSAWSWGPGEDGRHDIVGLPVDPDDMTGWQLCDGSTVDYLLGDGTTASFTTPDLTSAANMAAYLKLGTPVSGPNAAVAPTFTGAADTTSSDTAGIPEGSIAVGVNSGAAVAIGGGAASAAPAGHTHTATFTGSAMDPHSHTVTATGTISDDGEPRNYEVRPWFRR